MSKAMRKRLDTRGNFLFLFVCRQVSICIGFRVLLPIEDSGALDVRPW